MGKIIAILCYLSLSVAEAAQIQLTVERIEDPKVFHGLKDLEKRIRVVDGSYTSTLEAIPEQLVSYNYSLAEVTNEGRVLAAIIAVSESTDPSRIADIIFLMDPLLDKAHIADNSTYLKFQLLEKLFSASGMANAILNSNRRFSAPRGDAFTLSYITSYLKLKGYEYISLVDGYSSEGLRSIEFESGNKALYRRGLPSYDLVMTGMLDIVGQMVLQDIRHRDQKPTRIDYDLAVRLSELGACQTLF